MVFWGLFLANLFTFTNSWPSTKYENAGTTDIEHRVGADLSEFEDFKMRLTGTVESDGDKERKNASIGLRNEDWQRIKNLIEIVPQDSPMKSKLLKLVLDAGIYEALVNEIRNKGESDAQSGEYDDIFENSTASYENDISFGQGQGEAVKVINSDEEVNNLPNQQIKEVGVENVINTSEEDVKPIKDAAQSAEIGSSISFPSQSKTQLLIGTSQEETKQDNFRQKVNDDGLSSKELFKNESITPSTNGEKALRIGDGDTFLNSTNSSVRATTKEKTNQIFTIEGLEYEVYENENPEFVSNDLVFKTSDTHQETSALREVSDNQDPTFPQPSTYYPSSKGEKEEKLWRPTNMMFGTTPAIENLKNTIKPNINSIVKDKATSLLKESSNKDDTVGTLNHSKSIESSENLFASKHPNCSENKFSIVSEYIMPTMNPGTREFKNYCSFFAKPKREHTTLTDPKTHGITQNEDVSDKHQFIIEQLENNNKTTKKSPKTDSTSTETGSDWFGYPTDIEKFFISADKSVSTTFETNDTQAIKNENSSYNSSNTWSSTDLHSSPLFSTVTPNPTVPLEVTPTDHPFQKFQSSEPTSLSPPKDTKQSYRTFTLIFPKQFANTPPNPSLSFLNIYSRNKNYPLGLSNPSADVECTNGGVGCVRVDGRKHKENYSQEQGINNLHHDGNEAHIQINNDFNYMLWSPDVSKWLKSRKILDKNLRYRI